MGDGTLQLALEAENAELEGKIDSEIEAFRRRLQDAEKSEDTIA